MPNDLTIEQIREMFESEWILVESPTMDESLEVLCGIVIAHSKDRDEVYRHAIEARPTRFAILYTGSPATNTALTFRPSSAAGLKGRAMIA